MENKFFPLLPWKCENLMHLSKTSWSFCNVVRTSFFESSSIDESSSNLKKYENWVKFVWQKPSLYPKFKVLSISKRKCWILLDCVVFPTQVFINDSVCRHCDSTLRFHSVGFDLFVLNPAVFEIFWSYKIRKLCMSPFPSPRGAQEKPLSRLRAVDQ